MNNASAPPAYNDIINSQKPVYPQQNFPQQNFPQQNFPQQNFPQQNFPQHGYPQHGYQQQSYPQQSYPHQSIVQVNTGSPAIVYDNSNIISRRRKIHNYIALIIIFVIIMNVIFIFTGVY